MAAALIYQGLEENSIISKEELRDVVNKAVSSVQKSTTDLERLSKLSGITLQFDIAFDSIRNLLDVGVIKTNEEPPLTKIEIEHNIKMLKSKLVKIPSALYQELCIILKDFEVSELTWQHPLASQVISSDSKLVEKLSKDQQKKFMKPAENMMPELFHTIQGLCRGFVLGFSTRNESRLLNSLSHNKAWIEDENTLVEVATKILETLGYIWHNPAFNPDHFESMNEGTYVNGIIVPLICAALHNNPFGDSAFITVFERQSMASAERKKEGKGRRPDIMFIAKKDDRFYELMYSECSRIVCSEQKKQDDYVKLWRETNDGMYWAHKSRRLEKEKFSIIGIQVTGDIFCLNVLVRDQSEVHRYYKLRESKIPIHHSSDPSVTSDLIHTLLIFRNILIVNMSLLCSSSSRRSRRNTSSSTVSSDLE